MESRHATHLFVSNASAVAYMNVRTPEGDESIGTAFHVGDGVFVTARHVVENNEILEVRVTEHVVVDSKEYFGFSEARADEYDQSLSEALGHRPAFKKWLPPLSVERGPLYPKSPDADVAIFKVRDVHSAMAVIRLGLHLDDWILRVPWQLCDSLILGYPPVPFTNEPVLIPARAEVHAVVNVRDRRNLHFLLSATPRGGFSGGPALHEEGFALGVIVGGLARDHLPTETGFFAVLSVEAIHECLELHGLQPNNVKERWDRLMKGPNR